MPRGSNRSRVVRSSPRYHFSIYGQSGKKSPRVRHSCCVLPQFGIWAKYAVRSNSSDDDDFFLLSRMKSIKNRKPGSKKKGWRLSPLLFLPISRSFVGWVISSIFPASSKRRPGLYLGSAGLKLMFRVPLFQDRRSGPSGTLGTSAAEQPGGKLAKSNKPLCVERTLTIQYFDCKFNFCLLSIPQAVSSAKSNNGVFSSSSNK